jgi:hypothetical protein
VSQRAPEREEEDRREKVTAVSPGGAGIGRGYLQICGAPARNFVSLAAI